jgi:hypothetical protein
MKNDVDVDKIQILFSKETEIGMLTYFTFINKNKDYEGLAAFSDNTALEIRNIAYEVIDRSVPMTHLELSASKDNGAFRIIGGQINSDKINYVNISFFNGTLAKVLKSEVNSYTYVDIENSGGVNSIKAFGLNDELVFEY